MRMIRITPRPVCRCMVMATCMLLFMAATAWADHHASALSLGSSAAPLADDAASESHSVLSVLQAGGWIGYAILGLSFVGLALVIDGFMRLREDKLVPPLLVEQLTNQAERGQFREMLATSRADDSLLGSILAQAMPEGTLGLPALREAVEQEGEKQITRLRQRVGYLGLIASIAPVLGLLGTVIGMIRSFQVLGDARGAARPDELAVGIAEALVTTCMGLILAVPLLFLHAYFRDRVTRIGQEAAGRCDRLLRIIANTLQLRQQHDGAAAPGAAAPAAPAPQRAQP